MKRILSGLLCLGLLLSALALPALADTDETEYCPSASMIEYRELFTELNRDLGMDLDRAHTAAFLYRLARLNARADSRSASADKDIIREAADWTVDAGIFSLVNGDFCPEEPMTRQTLCLALQAYVYATGAPLPMLNPRHMLNDAGDFTARGREAAALMQRAGVLIDEDAWFYPNAAVSGTEAQEIFLRFIGAVSHAFLTLPVTSVAESESVDNEWFDDACFIGHSQVVGMMKYFDLDNADYFAVVGHTVKDVLEYPYYKNAQGRYGDIRKALSVKEYGKVYVMLGINDCTTASDRIEKFKEPMRELLDIIKETQPDATVYLISLAPVGRKNAATYVYNLENVILYSQAVKDLAREYDAEYIDVFRLMCDNDGYLLDSFNAGDGIHIMGFQYRVIEDYLKCHTAG